MKGTFGKFELQQRLGAGGFGEVWKAWEPGVGRHVALKVLKRGELEDRARFEREARTAAGLQHPNIATVYEIGDVDGTPFIAMELVEGDPLPGRLNPADAARIVRDAAKGVQAAHEAGVIHRDLKPANLMIGRDGRVRVLDFGLARPVEGGSSLTKSGLMVGTPAYMSPEQAKAETAAIGPRSDVYGLGATLFEFVTGRPPFEDRDLISLVMRIIDEDPPRPMSLAPVDAGIESIILKCLEKEPDRRYASAAELADELQRYIDGEELSTVRVRFRWTKPRRVLAGTIVLIAALGVTAGGYAVVRARSVSAQEDLVLQMRRTASTCLQSAMELRRAGNVAGMEAYAKELDAICGRVMRERPALAEPYLLRGRMRRTLDENREALADQERALELDPLCHEARYERVVLRTRLYQDHGADVLARAWRDEGERLARMGGLVKPPTADAVLLADATARAMRAAIEADLTALPKEALAPGQWACAQGLLAWCREDRDAYALLERAGTNDALEALAYAEYYSGRLDSAEAWASRGLEADAGNAPLRLLRGAVRKAIAENGEQRGRDGARRLTEAEEDFALVCEQYPRRATGWHGRGSVAESRANWSAASNVVDTGAYEQAIAHYTRAIALDPASATLLSARGHARMNFATVSSDRGPEGGRLYELAIDDLLEARRLAPDSDEVLGTLGMARTLRALTLEARGTPSSDLFAAGLADLDEAVKLHAGNNLHLRAMALGNRGKLEDELHRDAREWYRRAAADWEQAVSLKPANAWLRLMRAVTRFAALVARSKTGEDVRPEQETALAEFGALVEDNPKSDMALVWAGTMWMNAGLARIRGGAAPEEHFKRALAYFDRAIELNPRRVEAWRDRGLLKSNWGGLAGQRGQDPRPLLEGAIADAGEAIKRDPARSDAWRVRGAARVNLAPHAADPAAEFARAEADFSEALSRDPRDVNAWSGRGSARLQLGWERAKAGGRPDEIFERALSDLNEALQRRPDSAEALGERGILRQTWGELVQRRRESGLDLHRAALEDLDRAIQVSPKDGNLWYYRGNARLGLAIEVSKAGRNATPLLKEAVTDWTEAERLAPWLKSFTEQKIRGAKEIIEEDK